MTDATAVNGWLLVLSQRSPPVYLARCLDRCQNHTVAFSRNAIHLPHDGVNYWRDLAEATI
jgi:hypothetical protein